MQDLKKGGGGNLGLHAKRGSSFRPNIKKPPLWAKGAGVPDPLEWIRPCQRQIIEQGNYPQVILARYPDYILGRKCPEENLNMTFIDGICLGPPSLVPKSLSNLSRVFVGLVQLDLSKVNGRESLTSSKVRVNGRSHYTLQTLHTTHDRSRPTTYYDRIPWAPDNKHSTNRLAKSVSQSQCKTEDKT